MPLWAVVPVKELDRAKERLAPLLPPDLRRALALAMLEDVLAALAATPGLNGIAVVTVDAAAAGLAARHGARILADSARDGHSAAVWAAARRLAAEGAAAMLTLPGDVPLATPREIARILATRRAPPALTIVPSRDGHGSNAILVSPPDAVPFAFGADSFRPHLRAAAARGIAPRVLDLPGVALDIDDAEDLRSFLRVDAETRTRAVLEDRLPSLWPEGGQDRSA